MVQSHHHLPGENFEAWRANLSQSLSTKYQVMVELGSRTKKLIGVAIEKKPKIHELNQALN